MLVEATALGVLAGAVIGLVIALQAARAIARVREEELKQERAHSDDLLSRLVARTHGEYAAFANPPEPARPYADGEVIFDATGLVEVQLEREDDRVG